MKLRTTLLYTWKFTTSLSRHSIIAILTVRECIAVFRVQLVSTTVDQVYRLHQGVDVRLQRSRVSEPVTSLSDVASSDTESSDTATNTTDELIHSQGRLCATGLQSA